MECDLAWHEAWPWAWRSAQPTGMALPARLPHDCREDVELQIATPYHAMGNNMQNDKPDQAAHLMYDFASMGLIVLQYQA